jgi:hypothetical protein
MEPKDLIGKDCDFTYTRDCNEEGSPRGGSGLVVEIIDNKEAVTDYGYGFYLDIPGLEVRVSGILIELEIK